MNKLNIEHSFCRRVARSFSKSKIIRTCLRSSVSDENLSFLADLGIENNIARNLNFSELGENFADV
jgi:hypothetical protein